MLKNALIFNTPNPNPSNIPDALWWLWLKLQELEPDSQNGGILARKPGYHGTGAYIESYYPDDYSIVSSLNRGGNWRNYASALDWTFPDAQDYDYSTISRYTRRLLASGKDMDDPRLDGLAEFYGCIDGRVRGWDIGSLTETTSDSSHLWHIHFSFWRSVCNDLASIWAIYTVLCGWTTEQWRSNNTNYDGNRGEKVLYMLKQNDSPHVYVSDGINRRYLTWNAFLFLRDVIGIQMHTVTDAQQMNEFGGILLGESK
jgi:hypothetical protein